MHNVQLLFRENLTIKVIALDLEDSRVLEVWRPTHTDTLLLVHIEQLSSLQQQRGVVQVTILVVHRQEGC